MKDEKYIVFKREDFDQMLIDIRPALGSTVGGALNGLCEKTVNDAVVIRLQDMFAGPALHAYASSIQTVIELLESLSTDEVSKIHGVPGMTPLQMHRLHEVRDYFFQQALDADDVKTKKVPD